MKITPETYLMKVTPEMSMIRSCVLICLSSCCVPYVARFSGLSIFDFPIGIL